MSRQANIALQRTAPCGLAAELGSFGLAGKAFLLSMLLMLGGGRLISACSCIQVPGDPNAPPSEVVGDDPDSVVILGTVESVRLDGDWPPGYSGAVAPTIAVLKVDRYWGGARISAETAIRTENVGAACGIPWQGGECWLIEAWKPEGGSTWQSSTCSITAKVVTKPDSVTRLIATDGPGRVP